MSSAASDVYKRQGLLLIIALKIVADIHSSLFFTPKLLHCFSYGTEKELFKTQITIKFAVTLTKALLSPKL